MKSINHSIGKHSHTHQAGCGYDKSKIFKLTVHLHFDSREHNAT